MNDEKLYYDNKDLKLKYGIEHIETKDGYHYIKYKNNEQTYPYKSSRLIIFNVLETYKQGEAYAYIQKQPVMFKKLSLLSEEFSNEKYILIYNDENERLYKNEELTLYFPDKKNSKCLEYFKEVAMLVGSLQTNPEAETINVLQRQYEQITSIAPHTVLGSFTSRTKKEISAKSKKAIFPFSYNYNQKLAVQKAVNSHISSIKGPPGTGKTQTILNIIANLIMSNKTIAVVSNNNTAIQNIYDKYQACGLSFFLALLGKNENIDNFIINQSKNELNLESWQLDSKQYEELELELNNLDDEIDKILRLKTKLASFKNKLKELDTEVFFFQKYLNNRTTATIKLKNSNQHSNFFFEYNNALIKGNVSFIFKTIQSIKYRQSLYHFLKEKAITVNNSLQNGYYIQRKNEIERLIDKYSKIIENANIDEKMKEYTDKSMLLFKAHLTKRFKKQKNIFCHDDLKWKSAKFVESYPVIFSTTHSLKKSLSPDYIYDYLIIDEASQIDIIAGALAMSCAENLVIVGDTKQLPNIIDSDKRKEAHEIFNKYQLEQGYDYSRYNLMSSMNVLFPELEEEAILLNEHFRCHPMIIGFCNSRFYNNQLVPMTNHEDNDHPMTVYKTVKHPKLCEYEGKSPYNSRQANLIEKEIIYSNSFNIKDNSVGIITPFRAQVDEIKRIVSETGQTEIDTIHKFQGREKDIIIFSTVKDKLENGFIDEPMINVAVSRAIKQFYIVIPENEKNITNTVINDLIGYIRHNKLEVIDSSLYSIFDLFYKEYSDRLNAYHEEYIKNYKDDNDIMSEKLIQMLLDELLALNELSGLKYLRNYPLYLIFDVDSNEIPLDVREKEFIQNTLSHIDFIIINNCDKTPLLGIEVDGSYHLHDSKQRERDSVKDSIFKKHNIPLLRLSTRRSTNEKERILFELYKIRGIKSESLHPILLNPLKVNHETS
ncbi:MAG: AAA domain-containing protein [Deferribacterales bacterium]